MFSTRFLAEHRPKIIVALVLTFISGLVDIVGYLGVYNFFTAHLTGTTVQLGSDLVDRDWAPVIAAVTVVLGFLSGSVLGRALIEIGSRRNFRRIASVTLSIEAIMLAALCQQGLILTISSNWGLALLAGSMGLQTATLTGVGPLTIHTTFVTGMVNKLSQLVSHIAFRAYDLFKTKSRVSEARGQQEAEIQMAALLAVVWVFYIGGAAVGRWSFNYLGLRALVIAVCLLAIGLITDQFSPLSIEEEKEQSER